MKRKSLLFVALLCLMFAFPMLALAQSEVPPGTPPAEGALTAALELLMKALSDVTFLPVAAGFVLVATALLKKVIPVNPVYIALTLQVLAWVAWVLAKHYGYGDQFDGWIGALTTILTALAGLAGSTILATKGFNSSVRADVPLLGDTQGGTAHAAREAIRSSRRSSFSTPHR